MELPNFYCNTYINYKFYMYIWYFFSLLLYQFLVPRSVKKSKINQQFWIFVTGQFLWNLLLGSGFQHLSKPNPAFPWWPDPQCIPPLQVSKIFLTGYPSFFHCSPSFQTFAYQARWNVVGHFPKFPPFCFIPG